MASQSKPVLTIFIIAAGLIFAVALGWKFLGSKEAVDPVTTKQVAEKPLPQEITTPVAEPSNKELAALTNEVEPEPFLMVTEEDKEARKEVARDNMRFAMRLNTAEKAIAALKKYKDNGQLDQARGVLNFIQTTYPNESIPAELVDL